jgi:hypothetical protein
MYAAADSGCDETAQLMCEHSNHGLCRLQRKSWHCGDALEMDVLLGLLHCWRWSGEPYIPVCRSVVGISANCQRELSRNRTSRESGCPPPRFGRYTSMSCAGHRIQLPTLPIVSHSKSIHFE